MPGEPPIRHVSDTALWVAIYRAMESERPDAIFNDPFARRLGGERGETIVRTLPKGAASAWPMIVRTAVMDEIILRLAGPGRARTVVNLAAGLDTRPYRLPLPPSLDWIHVDLPDMIAYVRERLDGETARCRLEYLASDLTERASREAVMARVARGDGPALAVTEGLLGYLRPEQVADLARALAACAAIRWWLIDLASPKLLEYLKKTWQPHLQAGNAPLIFGPAEGTAFFAPYGWREAEYRSMWEEAGRLQRTMRGAWLWNLLSLVMTRKRREEGRRMSGMVLLERA